MNYTPETDSHSFPTVEHYSAEAFYPLSEEEMYEVQLQYDEQIVADMQAEKGNSPSYLPTVSMPELYDMIYPGKPPVIDKFLYPGTYLFVGAPKVGKSFMMAQIAYHVSSGKPIWNYAVRQGTVLYLALEDDYKRLQASCTICISCSTVTVEITMEEKITLRYDESHSIVIEPESDDEDTYENEFQYQPVEGDPNAKVCYIGNGKDVFADMTEEEKENFILTSY